MICSPFYTARGTKVVEIHGCGIVALGSIVRGLPDGSDVSEVSISSSKARVLRADTVACFDVG